MILWHSRPAAVGFLINATAERPGITVRHVITEDPDDGARHLFTDSTARDREPGDNRKYRLEDVDPRDYPRTVARAIIEHRRA